MRTSLLLVLAASVLAACSRDPAPTVSLPIGREMSVTPPDLSTPPEMTPVPNGTPWSSTPGLRDRGIDPIEGTLTLPPDAASKTKHDSFLPCRNPTCDPSCFDFSCLGSVAWPDPAQASWRPPAAAWTEPS